MALAACLMLPVAAGLAGCDSARDAVAGATQDAKQQAAQKAQDLAVTAAKAQVCAMTADGALSRQELAQLRSELDAASAAGLPAQVADAVRPLLQSGAKATKAQVRQVHAAVCAP